MLFIALNAFIPYLVKDQSAKFSRSDN